MEQFSNPIFIILFTTGSSIWLVCYFVLKNPPRKINSTYGYRTPRSMKSQEAWDYAQISGTEKMKGAAQIMCVFSIVGLFIKNDSTVANFVAVALVIIGLLIPLVLTEQELKEKFPS